MAARKRKTDNEQEPDLVIKPIPRAVRAALSQKKDDDTPDGIMLNALHDYVGKIDVDASAITPKISVTATRTSLLPLNHSRKTQLNAREKNPPPLKFT